MLRRTHNELGETLLEILIAVVIIGLVVSAYFATYTTSSLGSKAQRDLVTADGILRDNAEAINAAVRHDCATSATYTATTPSIPPNFLVTLSPPTQNCPPATAVQPITVTVQLPGGTRKSLDIEVRSP